MYILRTVVCFTSTYISDPDEISQGQNYKHKKLKTLLACNIVIYIQYVLIVLGTV
jgi:hypothetical protein